MRNITLRVLSFIFTTIGGIFIYLGLDKKNNYMNIEGLSTTINAYVGGDAYNYIINALYFVGYTVIGCTCLIMATMMFLTSYYNKDDKNK